MKYEGVEGEHVIGEHTVRAGSPVDRKLRLVRRLGSVPIFLFPSPNACFDGEAAREATLEMQSEPGLFSNCLCTLLCLSACSNFRSYGENSNVF